jgi:hypothetical protein
LTYRNDTVEEIVARRLAAVAYRSGRRLELVCPGGVAAVVPLL